MMVETLEHFDPRAFTALNQEFHAILFEKCANPRMLELVQAEWARLGHLRDSTFSFVPGRAAESRAPDRNELAATHVLRFAIDDASAKIRDGGVKDDPADVTLAHWAGVVPQHAVYGMPAADAYVKSGVPLPASVHALLDSGVARR